VIAPGNDWPRLFEHYDRNGSGGLDHGEFTAMMRFDLKVDRAKIDDVQVTKLFEDVDEDGDGMIDVGEFTSWLSNTRKPAQADHADMLAQSKDLYNPTPEQATERGVPFVAEYIALNRVSITETSMPRSRHLGYLQQGEIVVVVRAVENRMWIHRLRMFVEPLNGWCSERSVTAEGRFVVNLEQLPRREWSSGPAGPVRHEKVVAERVALLTGTQNMVTMTADHARSQASDEPLAAAAGAGDARSGVARAPRSPRRPGNFSTPASPRVAWTFKARDEDLEESSGPRQSTADKAALEQAAVAAAAAAAAAAALGKCGSAAEAEALLDELEATPRLDWFARLGVDSPVPPSQSVHSSQPEDDGYNRFIRSKVLDRTRRMERLLANAELLHQVPGLQGLGDRKRLAVAKSMVSVHYEKGENIIVQGEIGDKFYIIEKGQVFISIAKGDSQVIVARLQKGAHFGEVALIKDQPRNATITAQTAVDCLELHRDAYLRHVQTDQLQGHGFDRAPGHATEGDLITCRFEGRGALGLRLAACHGEGPKVASVVPGTHAARWENERGKPGAERLCPGLEIHSVNGCADYDVYDDWVTPAPAH
jgi:hypothetical protein